MTKEKALLEKIKLFVLDLDGTFYLGDRILPNSMPFVERVRKTGRRLMFFTNNSSKTATRYIKKLGGMGLCLTREDIVTS